MACDLGLVVDEDQFQFPDLIGLRPLVVVEDQLNEFLDPIELIFDFELFKGMVIIELTLVFELFKGVFVFEPAFDFPGRLEIF